MLFNTRPDRGADRGSVSLWVAVMAVAVMVTLVLIVDGGAKIRAGNRADIAAAEAARTAVLAAGPRPAGTSAEAPSQWQPPRPTSPRTVCRGPR